MAKWFNILNYVAVMFLLLMLGIFYRQNEVNRVEYDTERLSYAIESAAEAAFIFAMGSGDLGVSYLDVDSVSLTPSFSLDVFEEMIALNYGMSICAETKAYIEEFIPGAILACNDGYYVTRLGSLDGDVEAAAPGQLGLYWSVKNPYIIETKTAAEETAISVRINSEDWIKSSYKDGVYSLTYGDSYADEELGGTLTHENVQRCINSTLSNAFAYCIDKTADMRGKPRYNVYLPPLTTATGINNIAGPSFIIVLQGADFTGEAKVQEAVISGFKTTKKVYLVGFIDEDGMKRYCYEGQLPEEMEAAATGFFYTPEEAAQAGYLPSYQYLQRPIGGS